MDQLPESGARRRMVISPLWMQGIILTFLVGFAILTFLAVRLYEDHPPIPDRVVLPNGQTLFTSEDILQGQQDFLTYGLMEYGSVYGHGAYLGPDFTADYLHREAELMISAAGGGPVAAQAVRDELRSNRYTPSTDILVWTPAQARAFDQIEQTYRTNILDRQRSGGGLGPNAIPSTQTIREITAFIAWTAWTAAADRPGQTYSYTNNWPPEPLVDNSVTEEAVVWSTLSIVALLGGTGVLLGLFGRYSSLLGWHGTEEKRLRFVPAANVPLTPGQKSIAWYFLIVAALFLVQTLLGGATAHYHVESGGFFGLNLAALLPYNLSRTWHVQLALFFVATAYLAAGIFIAPLVSRREPRGQGVLSYMLLGALVVVVVGSLSGEALSYKDVLVGNLRPIIGAQGWEYLDLGKVWQILLTVGMVFWCVILYRGLRRRLTGESWGNLPYLFFFSALSIPAFYAVGLVNNSHTNFAIADFWRFWVVHLWVEDFLELFTTILVAFIFVLLGVVSEKTATRVVYLDILLYSIGGVVGTMHHLYFSGTPAVHMALGAFFSAGEVIPLTFLTVEAWSFLQLGARQEAGTHEGQFPHRWAVMFLASVGFWNFLGAGVFGFLINLPVVSYYEIGTQLTANHAHAAMMGVYGMLAVALLVFCLRYLLRPEDWSDRWIGMSFWSLNLGLAWMVFANLFPIGILQLGDSVRNGYYHARSLAFFQSHAFIEWLRLPGDVVFILGVLPLVYYTVKAILRPKPTATLQTADGHAIETSLFMELAPGTTE
ncbi:MAG TPA: cbb3-type cytochrome c oxidase subunit I [Tepidisphaeraceae bacterium]|nr:cbb3-type cytochrome c oxidase subunit I [Tepidisphaeraceae bacterium]